jgi:hypothetical protein
MKKFAAVLIIFAMMFMMAACSDKTSLTIEEFVNLIEEAGYSVTAVAREAAEIEELDRYFDFDTGNLTGYATAVNDSIDIPIAIAFYVFSSAEKARGEFNENITNLKSRTGAWRSRVENNAANYNIYRGINDGVYFTYARIGNTLLVIAAEEELKAEVDQILEKLGYR